MGRLDAAGLGKKRPVDGVPLVALEEEWRLLAHGRLAVEFRRWQTVEPALRAFDGPERLLAFLWDERADPLLKDAALAALLRLARTEQLASRVVLQAMLPGLKTLAARLLRRSPEGEREPVLEREELWQVLFCALLERIRTYPLERRPRKIAANLLLDTLHATVAEMRREAAAREQVSFEAAAEAELVEQEAAAVEVVDVEAPLRRAVAAGVLSAAEAELILETEVDAVPLAEVAGRLGVTYNAVKKRRRRAERRLLAFLTREGSQDLYVQAGPERRPDRPSSGAYAPETNTPLPEGAAELPLAALLAEAGRGGAGRALPAEGQGARPLPAS